MVDLAFISRAGIHATSLFLGVLWLIAPSRNFPTDIGSDAQFSAQHSGMVKSWGQDPQLGPWALTVQCLAQEVLEEWLNCQRSWLYLEPIFSSEDINRQLPVESKRYQTMERIWRKIMKNAYENREASSHGDGMGKLGPPRAPVTLLGGSCCHFSLNKKDQRISPRLGLGLCSQVSSPIMRDTPRKHNS